MLKLNRVCTINKLLLEFYCFQKKRFHIISADRFMAVIAALFIYIVAIRFVFSVISLRLLTLSLRLLDHF